MSTSKLHRRSGASALALLCASASLASAQVPPRLTVSPLVGSVNPAGRLFGAPILSTGSVLSYPDFEPLPGLGVSVELRATSVLGVRLEALRTLEGSETGQWGCGRGSDAQPLACPAILILVPTRVRVRTATADLLAHFAVGRIDLAPLVGVGWTGYGYRWDPADVGSFSLAPGDTASNAAALHLGLASSVRVDGVRVHAEYGELRSRVPDYPTAPARLSAWTVALEVPVVR